MSRRFTSGQPFCPPPVLMRFITALQRVPDSIVTTQKQLYLSRRLPNLGGVLCLLPNDFNDEVRKTGRSKNGCHCQGQASQWLTDYLHSLRRDGDPYGSQEDGKTGDRYGGQRNVEYTATDNVFSG